MARKNKINMKCKHFAQRIWSKIVPSCGSDHLFIGRGSWHLGMFYYDLFAEYSRGIKSMRRNLKEII